MLLQTHTSLLTLGLFVSDIFPLKKSLFSFLSVCLGFLEKSFYKKKKLF